MSQRPGGTQDRGEKKKKEKRGTEVVVFEGKGR